jgi:hypothetical protein
MPVAIIVDFPHGTREQYDTVVERMALGGRLPAGGLFHAAGPTADGWRVIDVWEEPAAFERFADEKIKPLTADAGLQPPRIETVPVAQLRSGSGGVPELVQVVTLPGLDAETFHAADARVLRDGRLPEEITFHVNGPVDGGWRVIDAWTTKAARDRFLEERIKPALEGTVDGPPTIDDLMVHTTLGAAAHAHA